MNTLYTFSKKTGTPRPCPILAWMDYYRKTKNVSQTCRHFGISRKTFHHWKKRYDPHRLESLEEQSRRPRRTRQWEVSRLQKFRILALRRTYIRYGKEKIKIFYREAYGEHVSSWKIQLLRKAPDSEYT
jgi:transposase